MKKINGNNNKKIGNENKYYSVYNNNDKINISIFEIQKSKKNIFFIPYTGNKSFQV